MPFKNVFERSTCLNDKVLKGVIIRWIRVAAHMPKFFTKNYKTNVSNVVHLCISGAIWVNRKD